MKDLFLSPIGIKSSISSLPSLDEMLCGGIKGNWLLAGATSIGKTTLAVSYLANKQGKNKGTASTLIDYGSKQGQERYLEVYGLNIFDFYYLVNSDEEKLRDSRIFLQLNKKDYNKEETKSVGLGFIFGDNPEYKNKRITKADLDKKSKENVIKIDMRHESRNKKLKDYFGSSRYEKSLDYIEESMSALLHYSFKVNGIKRFLIDGLSINLGEKVLQEVDTIYKYINSEKDILLPFVGDNAEEFLKGRDRNTWLINESVSSLTSLTLTGDPKRGENVGDIDGAVNHVQALKMAQEIEGIITLGKNLNLRYKFDGANEPAPQNTRILSICKSRFSADENYREIILDDSRKPLLGRIMVPRI